MIKLIACDIDGTLLLDGAQELSSETKELIHEVQKKGILFSTATGRQYSNLRRLFDKDDSMAYICENGGLAFYKGEIISKIPMDFELARAVAEDIYKIDGCEVIMNGKDTAYILPKYHFIEKHMRDVVHYNIKVIDSLDCVKDEVFKVAMYYENGVEEIIKHFQKKWQDKMTIAVSGLEWLDFMDSSCNKGNALAKVQEQLGIAPEETMVFGDNFNDIQMFYEAGYPYVMKHANPDVKKHAKYEAECVEEVLKKILTGEIQ